MPFKDLVGHRSIVSLLARAISRDSLPPSLIFAGPAGVGKRTAATALAQALNCPNAGSLAAPAASRRKAGKGRARQAEDTSPLDPVVAAIDACGECGVCRRIALGTYSDVLVIEPDEDTGNIKVEPVRDAIERTAYRPFEGRRRVVIVDQAEAMNDYGQSSLLKSLEEPRPSSSFVLVTSHPDVLLPTVRSRCTTLRFGRLNADEVARVFVATGRADDKNARALAAIADGSPGMALGWKDQGFEDARDAAERVLQGVAQRADVRRRLEHAKSLLGKKSSRSTERDQTALRLRALGSLVRDLQLLSSGADEQWLANADLSPGLKRLAGSYDRERLIRAFAAVGESLEALDGNASPKIVADWMTLQI